MKTATKGDAERAQARERLLELLQPGATVYTALESVSRSGMYRRISLYVVSGGEIVSLNWYAAKLGVGALKSDARGLGVSGCGMDMGYHLVYALSRELWPDGHGCIGEGCPSNDHSNGDRDYTPHKPPSGCAFEIEPHGCTCHRAHMHTDGGYALRHRWLP